MYAIQQPQSSATKAKLEAASPVLGAEVALLHLLVDFSVLNRVDIHGNVLRNRAASKQQTLINNKNTRLLHGNDQITNGHLLQKQWRTCLSAGKVMCASKKTNSLRNRRFIFHRIKHFLAVLFLLVMTEHSRIFLTQIGKYYNP